MLQYLMNGGAEKVFLFNPNRLSDSESVLLACRPDGSLFCCSRGGLRQDKVTFRLSASGQKRPERIMNAMKCRTKRSDDRLGLRRSPKGVDVCQRVISPQRQVFMPLRTICGSPCWACRNISFVTALSTVLSYPLMTPVLLIWYPVS